MAVDPRLRERLEALTTPEFAALGLELVELEVLTGGHRLTLRFAIERAESAESVDEESRRASIKEIARASRAAARAIEAEEAEVGEFLGKYTIEASSPGIFRKLVEPEHFRRFLGRKAKLVVDTDDSSVRLRGELLEVSGDSVSIADENDGRVDVPFTRIKKANLDPDLDFGG